MASISFFCYAEFVIRLDENIKDGLECFKFTRETSASASQKRYVMSQVCVYPFDGIGVVLVVDIAYVLPWIDYIHISYVSVRTIVFCFRTVIDDALYAFRGFVESRFISYDLAGHSAHHRHYIGVLPRLFPALLSNKPIQLIQF